MLISVCGVDGSGKSTYIAHLKSWLEESNKVVRYIDPMQNGPMMSLLKENAVGQGSKNIAGFYPPTIVSSCYAMDMLLCMNSHRKSLHEITISHRYDVCCKVYALSTT